MQNRVLIKNLKEHIDSEVLVAGWINVRRDHGKLIFLDIRDGSGIVQAVVLPDKKDILSTAEKLRPEWVVEIKAKVNRRPEKMINAEILNGDIELEILGVEVVSEADELPFEKDVEVNIDTYLDNMPFTLRSEKTRAIFKVQSEIVGEYRRTLADRSFIEYQSPKLVGDDAEGGGNVFKVDYFNDKTAFLATSPQLYKQIMVGVYEKVFTTSTVFRAEKHSTTRHINEYTSLDAELGFIKDHNDVLIELIKTIRSILSHVADKCQDELKVLNTTLPKLPQDIPVMKLREVQELIKKETGEDCTGEPDLEPSHERWICKYALEKFGSDFVAVTHYPVSKRPFYTYEDEDDLSFTKSFDLLCRGVEITTGGQRINNHDQLVDKIKEKGLDPESFSFYLQAFKYGMPPHGGWGMGLERLTQKFLDLDNVKKATLFPREINRIDSLLSK